MPQERKVQKLTARGIKRDLADETELVEGSFAELIQGRPRSATRIDLSSERSAEANEHPITCEDTDVVELTLEGDLRLYTSVGRLQRDVIPVAQARGATAGELVIPRRIRFPSQHSRGVDEVLVEAVELLDLKGKIIDKLAEQAGKGAAKAIAGWLEDKLVGDGGLFRIEQIRSAENNPSGTPPQPLDETGIDNKRPVLLFIHGTASRTYGSFSDLWTRGGDEIWSVLTRIYGENILGFEHRTLTESPIKNALSLVNRLPEGAHLHLVSHSRGGLVGELLCRGQFSDGREAFTQEDTELFEPDGNSRLQQLFELGADQDDYRTHLADLTALNAALKQKALKIERFVRVACPARGTTLASGKLDLYLSALLNVVGLIPPLRASGIYDFLKAFVLAVAKQRTRPEELPGLEAQMPGSPFITMLNGVREASAAHLAVIEGDIQPTGVLKKIALFLVDRFYESDHDLVVNTPSMDGGSKRIRPVPILSAQGNEVHHFSYFANSRSRRGLAAALQAEGIPADFQLRQPRVVEIARSLPRDRQAGEVPVVFVLPGISGSHIKLNGNRIWVDVFDLIRGRFQDLHIEADGVMADAPVAGAYGELTDFLAKSHEVIPFAYDWRCSILDASRELAAAVDERLRNTDQPVRIVAHSMGGLVARGMMRHEDLWNRMRQRDGCRVLMLGTPNQGSHSIPRLFALQDKLIKWLAFADIRHDEFELLDTMRHFPGVLELLPLTQDNDFYNSRIWKDFATALGRKWHQPEQEDLDTARNTWTELNKVKLDPAHVFYIAGQADETPVEVKIGDGRIRFLSTTQGDGRVPWEGGIPQGIKHWFVDAVHGDIADHTPAFEAMLQILETGDTRQLPTRMPLARAVEERREMLTESVEIQPSAAMLEAAALGSSVYRRAPRKPLVAPIKISVCHGDLCFTDAPIMVGHYQSDTIVSAESALDNRLDGRLRERYQLGLYPGRLMTNEVLLNERDCGQFPGAIIVGLGEVGGLTPGGLTNTFRDALLHFAVTVLEKDKYQGTPIRVSSLLIGTGSGGLSLDDAIASMLRAAIQANRLLAGPTCNVDRTIDSLQFIELFEDMAVKTQRELLQIEKSPEFRGHVVPEPVIRRGDGGQARVFYEEDEAWWQRLRIESTRDGGLKFTALTKRARAEMQTQPTQRQSVEPFLDAATADTSIDTKSGRVLFELLVPHDFKNYARDSRNLMLVLDDASAAYPWELMEYAGREGNQALALQARMIRQLATPDYSRPNLCTNGRALVIGDPQSDFAELPGARQEAEKVTAILTGQAMVGADSIIRRTGKEILSALMADQYQVLHLAGHGVVDYEQPTGPDDAGDSGSASERKAKRITGMVIGPGHFLTPIEIRQMPATPELIFINCCHLGLTEDNRPTVPNRPHRLAANLATQLIRQGARAVIAAGWAVDDAAALTFATRFYRELLAGNNFGEAVYTARRDTNDKHPGSNTWGAYQCYGDPDYRLSTSAMRGQSTSRLPRVSQSEYLTDIRNITEEAKTASEKRVEALRGQLDSLLDDIPDRWAGSGELQAALGQAWGELDRFQRAIDAYQLAIAAEDGRAMIRTAEQLANMEARLAVDEARAAQELRTMDKQGQANTQFKLATRLIRDAKRRLNALNKELDTSVERLALLGSACKRSALVYSNGEKDAAKALPKMIEELEGMGEFYKCSYQQALQIKGTYPYPLLNWLTAQWLLHKLGAGKPIKQFKEYLQSAETASPVPELNREHFWNAITQADCQLLRALHDETFATQRAEIGDRYRRTSQVAASPRQFRSVIEHLEFLRDILNQSESEQIGKEIDGLIEELRAQ